MFTLWWYKGRDPDPGRSVAPMYEPPPGMSPAEAGALLDDTVHPRDITSTIVDLAVRGYVKIEETAETNLLIFHSKDYIFHLLKPADRMARPGTARKRDAGKHFCRRPGDSALQPEEPFLHRNPHHQAGYKVGAEDQRHVSARSRLGQRVQRGSRSCDCRSVSSPHFLGYTGMFNSIVLLFGVWHHFRC